MIDFKKRLKTKDIPKKINPIDIYDSLDRHSETGPLRPSQKSILDEWFDNRKDERDNIIKLHTGEGKTLIGLLILQAKLNIDNLPCIYVCPNIYLAEQVKNEAKKFGIPYTEIDSSNELPDEFLSGKKILITYVQKVFHGLSIFGIGSKSIDIGTIILDDSHSCIESIRNALTIKVKKEHDLYRKIIDLLSDDIKGQGEGSFLEIQSGDYNTMLPIPYWSWYDKKDEILNIISSVKGTDEIKYVWPIIKDNIYNCQAFISGHTLEISPTIMPIEEFGVFNNAKHRILMSATTQDDAFFIKDLGFKIDSVKNPLSNSTLKWSGEKMIILPSLIDDSLNRENIIHWLGKPDEQRKYGIVSLTPSFKTKEQYEKIGALVAMSSNIFDIVNQLKDGNYKQTVVFANRYDGIDLPDDSCRILILDSKPYFDSLLDRYEEDCRPYSDTINIRVAQKIEQGLGRSVRGEKDYSIIVITGGDIVKFIKSPLTSKYFSSQTKKQIELGIQIAQYANEDANEEEPIKIVSGLMQQSLSRDEGWKEYYIEEMSKIEDKVENFETYDILEKEYLAEKSFLFEEYDKAINIIQELIDKQTNNFEKGWYLQQLARYKYRVSKVDSNQIQKSAFKNNNQLLKPIHGITYKKLEYINENRIERIKKWLSQYDNYKDMIISLEGILQDLSFGMASEKFELSLKEVGEALGFLSQRPDKEIKKGPDNLWCGIESQYLLFECKNEVALDRAEITKDEAGQMNTHCGWFDETYGTEVKCKRILIIPTRKLSYQANFTHDIYIINKAKLNQLKTNIKNFFKEFEQYSWGEITSEKIQSFLDMHKLDISDLVNSYTNTVIK